MVNILNKDIINNSQVTTLVLKPTLQTWSELLVVLFKYLQSSSRNRRIVIKDSFYCKHAFLFL